MCVCMNQTPIVVCMNLWTEYCMCTRTAGPAPAPQSSDEDSSQLKHQLSLPHRLQLVANIAAGGSRGSLHYCSTAGMLVFAWGAGAPVLLVTEGSGSSCRIVAGTALLPRTTGMHCAALLVCSHWVIRHRLLTQGTVTCSSYDGAAAPSSRLSFHSNACLLPVRSFVTHTPALCGLYFDAIQTADQTSTPLLPLQLSTPYTSWLDFGWETEARTGSCARGSLFCVAQSTSGSGDKPVAMTLHTHPSSAGMLQACRLPTQECFLYNGFRPCVTWHVVIHL